MRQDGSSRWMRFAARQWIDAAGPQFDWTARCGPAGLIRVRDALLDGEGRVDVRLLGIVPVARASGAAVTRGEVMRYLAELPWCPDAILRNRQIAWEVEGGDRLTASLRLGEIEGRVLLELDGEGRVGAISAPDRPRSTKRGIVETPWWGRFSDYRRIDGRQVPFRGEVGWEEDGRRFTVWEGRIIEWSVEV